MTNTDTAVLDKLYDAMDLLMKEKRGKIYSDHSEMEIYSIFATLGKAMVDADRASFWKWDKKSHKLVTAAATGTNQIVISDNTGIVGEALALNQPLVVNDPKSNPKFNAAVDKATGYETKSIIVLPVSNCRGDVIGAFQAINKNSGNQKFNEASDIKRLSIAAFICGLALESDLSMADAEHDKLTGLKNRCSFYNDWQIKYRPMIDALDSAESLSFVLCDIDFFKKVNDTHGHNAGDAILEMVAGVLLQSLPPKCNAYRWGGEEFIMVLVGKTLNETADVAENIRRKISESVCKTDGKELKVTMSFGCSLYDKVYSLDENIAKADARLYLAKDKNRNCVVCSDE